MDRNQGSPVVFLTCLLLAAICLMSPALVAEPAIAGVSHVELRVSDLEASQNFYSTVFGTTGWRRSADGRYWLAISHGYLILKESAAPGVSRTAFAVDDFESRRLRNYLESQQIRVVEDGGTLLSVSDGDGIHLALASTTYPQQQLAELDAVSDSQDGIFQPLLLDEVHIMVSNMEVDSLFYSRLLGRTGAQQAGSLWYNLQQGRLRLTQVPPGQSPGVNYLSILVANTDLDAASERVFAAGGLIENLLQNGFSFWDPDGMRVLVRTTTQH